MVQRQRGVVSLVVLGVLAGCSTSGSASSSSSSSSSSGASSVGASSSAATSAGVSSSAVASSSAAGTSQASSAAGSSGSSSTAQARAECTTNADCTLVDDCCNCLGVPDQQRPPVCGISTCLLSTCTSQGYANTLKCVAGRCVAGWNCDPSGVICRTPEPVCRTGTTPAVDGTCWGSCVPSSECAKVGDCSQCGAGEVCVYFGGASMSYHCVDIPSQCNGTPTCACMGASVCGAVACADQRDGLVCQGL